MSFRHIFPLLFLPVAASAATAPDSAKVEPILLDRFAVTSSRDPVGYVVATAAAATKLPTPLDRIPQAIAVVPDVVLAEQDATTVLDGIRNVSAVHSRGTDAAINEDFTLRGFRTDDRRNYFRNGIRYFNGYPAEIGNLERMEVLKGPASVLYGAVEPGGIINLVTRRPAAVRTQRLAFSADSEGSLAGRAEASGPLDPAAHWRYRLYGTQRAAGSFRNVVEHHRTYLAPALTWLPSARTTVDLEFEYLRDSLTPDTGIPAVGTAPAPLRAATYLGEPFNYDRRTNRIATLRVSHAWTRVVSLNSSVSAYRSSRQRYEATPQDPNFGLLNQNGGPGRPRQINRSLFINDYTQSEYSTQNDLVARLGEGAFRHTLLAGGDARRFRSSEDAYDGIAFRAPYFISIDQPIYGQPFPPSPGYPKFFRTTYPQETAVGAYVQNQLELGPRWHVLAGARHDRSRFRQTQVSATGMRTSFDQTTRATTPRLGLLFKPVELLSLYGSYSRSFSPKIGTLFPNSPVLPERARQLEGGLKLAVPDGRLSATLAAYEIRRHNVVVADPARPGFSLQIGEQRGRGLDLDVAARLAPGWNVIASYALIDAEITADTRLPVGNRLDNAPRDSGSLWSSYRFAPGPLAGFGFGAGAFVVGRRQGNLENNFELPGYTRLDAAVYYRRGRFDAALHVKNLADRLYYQNSWRRDRVMPGLPLTVSATVGLGF
jgi:iron complex outermembrane receptor protein